MQRIVLCDFDGTITVGDTFVAMLQQFTPALLDELMPEIYAQRVTLRQGVRQLVNSIPSDCYPAILEFMQDQPIRPGWEGLLDFLQQQEVPLVIVSGGMKGMVETVVQPFLDRIHAIHAMEVNTDGPYLDVRSAYESETEVVAKAQIMAAYGATQTIAIGDSITDLQLALQAPIVFARDRLARYLNDAQKPYIPWDDFCDIQSQLQKQFFLGS